MNLFQYFNKSLKSYPQNTALVVDEIKYSYTELHENSNAISIALETLKDKNSFVGFLAHRSITAFSSVLGILLQGKGYVPLNPKFPTNRIKTVVELSGIETLIIGNEAISIANSLLEDFEAPLNLILCFEKKLLSVSYLRR